MSTLYERYLEWCERWDRDGNHYSFETWLEDMTEQADLDAAARRPMRGETL